MHLFSGELHTAMCVCVGRGTLSDGHPTNHAHLILGHSIIILFIFYLFFFIFFFFYFFSLFLSVDSLSV